MRLIRYTIRESKGGFLMGKDRQEKRLKQERRVESDRDPKSHPKGSTYLDTPEQAREDQKR